MLKPTDAVGQAKLRSDIEEIAKYARHLPSDIKLNDEVSVRDDLQVIIGSATAIAELLQIEL